MSGRNLAHGMFLGSLTIAFLVAIPTTESNLALAQSTSIAGHVLDASGQPLPGVSVTAISETGGVARSTKSARDGAYQFEGLSDGLYRVDFDLTGFDLIRRNHVRVSPSATIEVNAALPVSGVCECVELRPPMPLRGRSGQVLDKSGRPLAHARIEIVNPVTREVAYADTEGRFRVRAPVSEPWPLTASDSGFSAVTQQVTGAQTVPVVFRLPATGTSDLPDRERFSRGCRCPGDLFTHPGR
jgi:hypothetical protein